MSEQTNREERAAIQTVAAALGESMRRVAFAEEAQQVAILGTASIVACLPETAQIPRERLAAVVSLLTSGQSDDFRRKVAEFIGTAVTVSQRLPEVVAAQQASLAKKN